jgi:hypothetical protein
MNAVRVVVLPLSKEPLWESTGLFLGTFAFPENQPKARRYAQAWCRDGVLRLAASNRELAQRPAPLKPSWFLLGDQESERLFKEADKAFLARKAAYVASQAEFFGALNGLRITTIGGFGDRVANTRENAYVKTNVWLRKRAGASTKPLIRDAITPSKPVIHVAFAVYDSVKVIINETWDGDAENLSTERGALLELFHEPEIFSWLLDRVEECRLAALKAPALKATPEDLIQFVVE